VKVNARALTSHFTENNISLEINWFRLTIYFCYICEFEISTTHTPPHGMTVRVGLGLLVIEVSRSHSDTSHTLGLLSTSQRPLPDSKSAHNRQTSMPPAGFEPAILAIERSQTHASDRRDRSTTYVNDVK